MIRGLELCAYLAAVSAFTPAPHEYPSRTELRSRLLSAQRLAEAGKMQRLLHNPVRYTRAQWHRHVLYRHRQEGRSAFAKTIYDQPLQVILPAGMDVYLLGAKGHVSELRLARLLIETLQPGDTFIDVGAHFGFYSGLAASLVGAEGRVLAVEAALGTYEVLTRNLASFPQAECYHIAVSDKKGKLRFTEFPVAYSEYNTLRPQQFADSQWLAAHPGQEVEVRALALDELLGDQRVDFIKIDVEGAEDACVAGMKRLLQRTYPPLICIEYLATSRGNTAHRTAIDTLLAAGLQLHEISAEGALLPTTLPEVDAYLASSGEDSCNLVVGR